MPQSIPTTITCLMLPLAVFAAEPQSIDKSDYSLFNPVPGDQLRPLSSQAYDGVSDARTLDAGHVQVEGEFINYFFNSTTPYHYSSDGFLWEPRISVGLLNNVDFYVRPSYEIRSYDYKGGSSEFGRITTGVKINLWGNDGGTTALAVKPYLSIPTEGGDVLGGGDVALLVRLPHGFYVKFDSEFYATENNSRTLFAGFDNSMSINKSLYSKADAYWYLDSTVTTDSAQQWYGYTGFGLNYNFTSNLQIFAGIGFGLTSSAYDYNPRFGFAWRF
ncbi:MAG: transporter [Verrucomicrobiota bacterium]